MCSDTADQPGMPCFKDQMNRRNSPEGTDTVEQTLLHLHRFFFLLFLFFLFLTSQDDEIKKKKDCEMSCG